MITRTRATVRAASSAALAVAALGALAGCASGTADAGSDTTASGVPSSSASTSASADSSASGATGTWTETGDYQTPGGQESVEVTMKVTDGTVESVEVVGSGGSPNSQRYQSQFISGVSAEVVGKPLADLKVGAVSGSSLTGQGFNAAVEKIRADAA